MSATPPEPARVPIVGRKAIAAHLGCAENTVVAYSRLDEDPLPIRMRRGTMRACILYLDEWKLRRNGGEGLARVKGWAAICTELGGCSQDTALRWARLRHDRLPVSGLGKRNEPGEPWIYAAALRDWLFRHDLPFQVVDRLAKTSSLAVLSAPLPHKRPSKGRHAA